MAGAVAVKAICPSFFAGKIQNKIAAEQSNQAENKIRKELNKEFFRMLGVNEDAYEKISKEDGSDSKGGMGKTKQIFKTAGEQVPDKLKNLMQGVGTEILGTQVMIAAEKLMAMVSVPPLSVLVAGAGISALIVAKIIQAKNNKNIDEIKNLKDNIEKAKEALESIMPEMVEKYNSMSKADFKKDLKKRLEAIFDEYGIPYTKKNLREFEKATKRKEESPKRTAENAVENEARREMEEEKLKEELAGQMTSLGGA